MMSRTSANCGKSLPQERADLNCRTPRILSRIQRCLQSRRNVFTSCRPSRKPTSRRMILRLIEFLDASWHLSGAILEDVLLVEFSANGLGIGPSTGTFSPSPILPPFHSPQCWNAERVRRLR